MPKLKSKGEKVSHIKKYKDEIERLKIEKHEIITAYHNAEIDNQKLQEKNSSLILEIIGLSIVVVALSFLVIGLSIKLQF